MIQDMQGRKASVFTSPEWQSRPYKNFTKGPDQKLYDIGAGLATILASADKSKTTQQNVAIDSQRSALLEECLKLAAKLEAWFQDLNEEIPPPHYSAKFSNIQNIIDDREHRKVFPVSFHFPHMYIAKVLMDYWALSILLYGTTFSVYQSFPGRTPPEKPQNPADDQHADDKAKLPKGRSLPSPTNILKPGSTKTFADNIAQSMEYCLSEDMGMPGPQ